MSEATPLKVRDYLMHGLPVLIAHDDTDFPGERPWYVLQIPNSEGTIEDRSPRSRPGSPLSPAAGCRAQRCSSASASRPRSGLASRSSRTSSPARARAVGGADDRSGRRAAARGRRRDAQPPRRPRDAHRAQRRAQARGRHHRRRSGARGHSRCAHVPHHHPALHAGAVRRIRDGRVAAVARSDGDLPHLRPGDRVAGEAGDGSRPRRALADLHGRDHRDLRGRDAAVREGDPGSLRRRGARVVLVADRARPARGAGSMSR